MKISDEGDEKDKGDEYSNPLSFFILLILLIPFVLLFPACTPLEQPFQTLRDVHTHSAISDTHVVVGDGTSLPVKSWLPEGKPKAVIVAVHGFNDYSNAFAGVGEYFKAHGMAVVAYDQRGFGAAPQTGIWAGEQNYSQDLADTVRQSARRWPHTPIYVLGESMGGAVTIVAVTSPGFPKVHGIILSAPALWGQGTMSDVYRATLWLAVHTVPGYKLSGSGLKIRPSNNIPMLKLLSADPLVIKETRVDTIGGLVRLMDSAYDKVPQVKVPVLLLYGGHDEVIPPAPIEASRPRFTAPLTYIYYPEGYHMLTRDLQGEQVMDDIRKWMEKK